jgi:CO/xanthine dehydrogenase Mo-binding subunit
MKFDTPATTNPIDQLKVVSKATDRVDGPLKTTGTAPYAYERHDVVPNQAYGYILGSAIAKGHIVSMDLAAAKASPGVIAIVTAENAGKLGKGNFNTAPLLGGPEIQHYHQAITVVVAESFEQARAAAHLVRVEYARAKGAFDLESVKGHRRSSQENCWRRQRREQSRRFRRRFRRRACSVRRHLHDGLRIALHDGAPRNHSRVGGRSADDLDLESDDRLGRG